MISYGYSVIFTATPFAVQVENWMENRKVFHGNVGRKKVTF